MDFKDKFAIYVGTVRGALASTSCSGGVGTEFSVVDSSCRSEVTALAVGRDELELLIGNRAGQAKRYDLSTKTYKKALTGLTGTGAVVGLGVVDQSLLVARESGHVVLWSKVSTDSFEVDGKIDCAVQSASDRSLIGIGGEGNDLKLWDVLTKKCRFRAKSMGHDELNLPIPTSVRGITFLSDLAACATKEGQVLVYDERAQRRPVVKFAEDKASYSTIAATYRERQCVVGTTKGYIQLLDLRNPSTCLRTFKSFTGAVTSVTCDPFSPVLASTSLDRYLRLHNLDTKELLYKEYLKQNLTKIVLLPNIKKETENDDTKKVEADEEYEAIFDAMPIVDEEEEVSRKRKVASDKKKRKKLSKGLT